MGGLSVHPFGTPVEVTSPGKHSFVSPDLGIPLASSGWDSRCNCNDSSCMKRRSVRLSVELVLTTGLTK